MEPESLAAELLVINEFYPPSGFGEFAAWNRGKSAQLKEELTSHPSTKQEAGGCPWARSTRT